MVIDLSEVTKAKSFAQVFFLQKINKVKIYSLFNSVKKVLIALFKKVHYLKPHAQESLTTHQLFAEHLQEIGFCKCLFKLQSLKQLLCKG